MGLLLAIEGIDGAGKGTQAARLAETAAAHGRRVASFSFPLYDDNPFSRAVGDYLNGEFGGGRGSPGARRASLRRRPLSCAPAARRGARGARPRRLRPLRRARTRRIRARSSTGDARARLLDWLDEVEYGEFALPRPQLVVLLDAPVALARQLVGRKAARGYTTLEADIHEADAGHSGATREVYLELAGATAGGSSRPRATTASRATSTTSPPRSGRAWSRCSGDVRRRRRAARGEAPAVGRARRRPGARVPAARPARCRQGALALLFAAELLGDHARVERRTHPDLYVLEPVGDQIRIDDIRALRSDLHMRPSRRRGASISSSTPTR